MYTLHMSWSFRAAVLMVLLAWGLAPQVVCFMPDETLTPSEIDCCKQMAGDCMANMSHACCQKAVRPDTGITAKVLRHLMPQLDVADREFADPPAFLDMNCREALVQNNHAPPPEPLVSSSVLRI